MLKYDHSWPYRVVANLVAAYWVCQLIFTGQVSGSKEIETRKEALKNKKESGKLVDWDYAGLQLVPAVSDTDKVNYYNLQHMRRQRLEEDPNLKKTESREKYEIHNFRQLYNNVFSTKPPHLRSSHENYIQHCKDEFFAKQREPENPKTSRERYEWHVKKNQGSFFGGKYDFDTYLAGNFTARRRRRAIDVGANKEKPAPVAQKSKRRRQKRALRKKVIYQTTRVVDYMNERDLIAHYDDLAIKMKKRFEWGSKECKPRAYYTSNESKKNKLYGFNERAILEKENAKKADYLNYMADEDYLNKPRAYYFRDDATYRNMPKKKASMMAYDKAHRGPKYHYRRIGWLNHDRKKRNAPPGGDGKKPYATGDGKKPCVTGDGKKPRERPTTKMPTWAVVHYRPFTGPWRVNLSAEIIEQVAEFKDVAKARQEALEATGVYKLKDELGNRTTYRLSTYRNFVEEEKHFSPYTFGNDPNDKYPELDKIRDFYLPSSEEWTTPKNYDRWIRDELAEYRKQYRGLTVREPFAHYPEYSWENIGFDINKIEDPFPPIFPLEKAQFNAKVLSEYFGVNATETTPMVHDDREWDSMGREKGTIYVPPTKKFYMPGDIF